MKPQRVRSQRKATSVICENEPSESNSFSSTSSEADFHCSTLSTVDFQVIPHLLHKLINERDSKFSFHVQANCHSNSSLIKLKTANKGNNGQVMRKLGDCQFKTFTVSALNATLPSWSKICVWKKKQGIKKGFYSTWVFLLFQRYEFYLRDKIAAVFPSTVGHTNSAVFYWQTCRRHVPASAFFSFFFFTEK